jgi:membrane-associated phospholipid phosphatase
MNPMQKWSIALLLTICAVWASYFWLDRPIAVFAHERLRPLGIFTEIAELPELMKPFLVVFFLAAALRALSGRPLARLLTVAGLAMASFAVAHAIKDQLKFAFGRTWPETWVRNNPSFIHDGVFGFFPFQGGQGFASFPSGHTTAICAVMSVLWICYPRFRLLYALVIAVVVIGIIGSDFHFLGDIIAGAFLGASIGWFTVVLWEYGERHVRGKALSRPFADQVRGGNAGRNVKSATLGPPETRAETDNYRPGDRGPASTSPHSVAREDTVDAP